MNEALKRIHMQVMWNRLIAVVEEQAQALLHTAFGAITREAGDLSAGVYDTGGRMLAQAVTGTPGHVNTMAAAVQHFLDALPARHDAPRRRLRDQRPVVRHRAPVRFRHGDARCSATRSRSASSPRPATRPTSAASASRPRRARCYEEGLCIPHTAAARAGRARREGVRDRDGELAQSDRGARRPAVADRVQRRGRGAPRRHDARVRSRRRSTSWRATSSTPRAKRRARRSAGCRAATYPTAMTARRLRVADRAEGAPDDRRRRDHRRLSRAARRCRTRGINSPQCYTEAYSVFGLKCIIAPAIPNNAGSLEPFRVLVRGRHVRAPAAAGAGHRAPRDRPDAARPDVRLPRAGARRPRAGRERGLDLGAADGGRGARRDAVQRAQRRPRRHRRAAGQGRAQHHRVSERRRRRPGRDHRERVAARLLGEGIPCPIPAAPASSAAGWAAHRDRQQRSRAVHRRRGDVRQTAQPGSGSRRRPRGAPGAARLGSGPCSKRRRCTSVPAGDRIVLELPGGGGVGDPARRERARIDADVAAGLVQATAPRATTRRADERRNGRARARPHRIENRERELAALGAAWRRLRSRSRDRGDAQVRRRRDHAVRLRRPLCRRRAADRRLPAQVSRAREADRDLDQARARPGDAGVGLEGRRRGDRRYVARAPRRRRRSTSSSSTGGSTKFRATSRCSAGSPTCAAPARSRNIGTTNFDTAHLREIVAAGSRSQPTSCSSRCSIGAPSAAWRSFAAATASRSSATARSPAASSPSAGSARADPRAAARQPLARQVPADSSRTSAAGAHSSARSRRSVAIGRKHGVSASSVAIRYVLDQPGATVAIVGAQDAARLAATLEPFAFALDDEDRAQIAARYRRRAGALRRLLCARARSRQRALQDHVEQPEPIGGPDSMSDALEMNSSCTTCGWKSSRPASRSSATQAPATRST